MNEEEKDELLKQWEGFLPNTYCGGLPDGIVLSWEGMRLILNNQYADPGLRVRVITITDRERHGLLRS